MSSYCPPPYSDYQKITLAHGGGGLLSQRLLQDIFWPAFHNKYLDEAHDGAHLPSFKGDFAVTTDAHVVSPLFFPGGDIGTLAVYGGLNDLASCGAKPRYLSMSFILEEGFPLADLKKIVQSIAEVSQSENVQIVTGDTKVVEKGKCEGVYISTTAIGETQKKLAPTLIQPGDVILVSGDLGRHGMSIMSTRTGLNFSTKIISDCANIWPSVLKLIDSDLELHCVRDLTRGGLAAALYELSKTTGLDFEMLEKSIPVSQVVRSACEVLGMDPIHVPNEGRFVAFLPLKKAERALELLKSFNSEATVIGRVKDDSKSGEVWIKGVYGPEKLLLLPLGDQLPRIC